MSEKEAFLPAFLANTQCPLGGRATLYVVDFALQSYPDLVEVTNSGAEAGGKAGATDT